MNQKKLPTLGKFGGEALANSGIRSKRRARRFVQSKNQFSSRGNNIAQRVHVVHRQRGERIRFASDTTRRRQNSKVRHDSLHPSASSNSDKASQKTLRQRDADFRGSLKFIRENKDLKRVITKMQLVAIKILADPQDDEHVSSDEQIAAAKIFRNIMDVWKLSNKDMAILLGNDQPDSYEEYIGSLLGGKFSFGGRDTKDRMAQIFQMRRVLCSLFRDDEVENEWLRESHELLDNKSPMDLMLEGSMENLSLVREFVETAAGL